MFRFVKTLASAVSDTFAPLFRSNLEQLQDAWKKTQADCERIMLLSAETTNATAGGAAGTAAHDTSGCHHSATTVTDSLDDPRTLLESPLVGHLNQLVEALIKEEEEQTLAAQLAEVNAAAAASTAGHEYYDTTAMVGSATREQKAATGPCFE